MSCNIVVQCTSFILNLPYVTKTFRLNFLSCVSTMPQINLTHMTPLLHSYRNQHTHIETSQLIRTANQMTGFYKKCNTGLKWVKLNKYCITENQTSTGVLQNTCSVKFRKNSQEDTCDGELFKFSHKPGLNRQQYNQRQFLTLTLILKRLVKECEKKKYINYTKNRFFVHLPDKI